MNKLKSLKQIKAYKAKELTMATHVVLSGTLKHFLLNPTITALTYTYSFSNHSLTFLHEKMTRIGTIADEMDHHPEWTLREGELEVKLSTHDIGNKVSLKDYVLASWIEKVLHEEELEAALLREWNRKELNL